ncbi:MAG: CPBP family intramembrane metalloprotease [candidate division Zixibacteria bacterium]|nr:CPBP family intramembrane metalloprotease [candidate division Zixibacteria bacterium]
MEETSPLPVPISSAPAEPAPPGRRPLKIWSILFLFFLLVFLPVVNFPPFVNWLMYQLTGTRLPPDFEKDIGDNRMFTYVATMVFQWGLVAFMYLALRLEKLKMADIGLGGFTVRNFNIGAIFLVASIFATYLLTFGLDAIGLKVNQELDFILPKTPAERLTWIFLAFTAGFCEEAIYRGYVISRLQLVTGGWLWGAILSALSFGSLHAYQGFGNIALISIYGFLLSLLFVWRKSLVPGIFAHFLLDVFAPVLQPLGK